MSLAAILYPSPTVGGHEEWTFANYQHHLAILAGMGRRFDQNFTLYRLWPAPQEALQGFLDQHQQQHNEMNAALGLPSRDLNTVDFTNDKQRDAWMWLHFLEHLNAAKALGADIA